MKYSHRANDNQLSKLVKEIQDRVQTRNSEKESQSFFQGHFTSANNSQPSQSKIANEKSQMSHNMLNHKNRDRKSLESYNDFQAVWIQNIKALEHHRNRLNIKGLS